MPGAGEGPSDRREPALKRVEGVIEQRNHILEEVNKLLSGHRLDRSGLEDIRKVMHDKWFVERAGMKAVMDYERGRAGGDPEKLARIRDVSHMFKGYAIESFDRVIEVKSFKDTGPVEPTGHEWQTASR